MSTAPDIYLDTSVIFAAILSPQGGARMLLHLGESGLVHLWVGRQVLKECEAVVRRKAAHTLPDLALLLEVSGIQIGPDASTDDLELARRLVQYPPDALVLAEAIAARPDWFVTHDRQHFSQPLSGEWPFRVGTPGDVLAWFRQQMLSHVKKKDA